MSDERVRLADGRVVDADEVRYATDRLWLRCEDCAHEFTGPASEPSDCPACGGEDCRTAPVADEPTPAGPAPEHAEAVRVALAAAFVESRGYWPPSCGREPRRRSRRKVGAR